MIITQCLLTYLGVLCHDHRVPESPNLARRAARHAALGDPARLAIAEASLCCDRSPVELGRLLGLGSNLLAHHLEVLEGVGLIERSRSAGDGRRRYVRLRREALEDLTVGPSAPALESTGSTGSTMFICTGNSARSQLAEALWRSITGAECCSAGTHPGPEVHPGALAAAQRAGLDLSAAEPRLLRVSDIDAELVVTVCDRAHEELDAAPGWLHWSIPDPVADGSPEAFDTVVDELTERIESLLSTRRPTEALR